MRRIIAIFGICRLGVVGCKHIGGKCDCGPSVGDPSVYATNPAVPVVTKSETINAPKPLPMPSK